MSDNLKVVQYFAKEVFVNNAQDADRLSNLVSPQFSYCLNLGDPQNYSQFVKRMQSSSTASTVVLGEIASEDDMHLHCDFEVQLPEPNQHLKTHGFSQLIVRNGIIHQIDINYQNSVDEYNEFRDIIKNSATVLL